MLYRIQSTALGQEGNSLVLLPGAAITVRNSSGDLARIYADADEVTELPNPTLADASGGYDFYAEYDSYFDVTVSLNGQSVDDRIYAIEVGLGDRVDAAAAEAGAQAVIATTQADTATAQAVISTDQAVISTAQAVIATNKAGEAATSAANAALFDGPKFDTIALMADAEGLTDGKNVIVWDGFNGEPETFRYDASSTLTADGALIVDATGMGVGRLVSTRTVYADFAEIDADPRTIAAGTLLRVLGGDTYEAVESEEDITLSGGLKVKIVIDDPTLFDDTATGEATPLTVRTDLANFDTAYYDKIYSSKSGGAPSIVCYGDSNTRYFQGDTSTSGPFSRSYGAFIDQMALSRPNLYGATVTINGFPGQTASYGDANFDTNVPADTSYLVIGFGTNDVKIGTPNFNAYLASIRSIISKALAQGTQPILLGIPWYSEAYGTNGVTSQALLKVWNARLFRMCEEAFVPFIDTYSLTREYTSVYFNETTLKRHYSAVATRVIAAKICAVIDGLMSSTESAGYTQVDNFSDLVFISDATGPVNRIQYTVGGRSFEVVQVLQGDSITIKGNGRGCLGFYPRAVANVDFVAKNLSGTTRQTGTISITNTIDAGEFYPILRYPIGFTNAGDGTVVTLTATTGDFFLRGVSFQDGLILPTNQYQHSLTRVAAASLPAFGVYGRCYWVTELNRPAYWNGTGYRSSDGLALVGTTSVRNSVSAIGCANGYKFYNTTTNAVEIWDGSAWV